MIFMVKIFIERENKEIDMQFENPISAKVILKKLNIAIESVIIVKNDEICLEDELIKNEDSIKLLSVVSGG